MPPEDRIRILHMRDACLFLRLLGVLLDQGTRPLAQ